MIVNKADNVPYKYADGCPSAKDIQIVVNGERVFLYHATVAYFAAFTFTGRADVEIITEFPIERAVVRPLNQSIAAEADEHCICFSISKPTNLFIEINDQRMPVFIFANPPETDIPSATDPDVLYFKAGQIYEVGTIQLQSNQTLYLEGGAVVRGVIRSTGSHNIRICGRGVLDGVLEPAYGPNRRHFVVLEGCSQVEMEGVILIEPPHWMIVLGNCEDIKITNIKEIGHCVSSDGIDIVGSRNVLIDGVFLRNNDDCIAIKSMDNPNPNNAKMSWSNDVRNIVIKNSVMYSAEENGGNCLEIGFELRTGVIENIHFENIDVIAVHGFGSIFSIHNGDRAIIQNICYENIRIEHFYDKLVDIRMVHSPKWNVDPVKGSIRNIHFKNIHAIEQPFNSGYTCSLIGGFAEHPIEGVLFENFYLNDKKVRNEDDLWLHTKHARNISFQ